MSTAPRDALLTTVDGRDQSPAAVRRRAAPGARAGVVLALMLLSDGLVARDAVPHMVYVTNEISGDLSVVDGSTRAVVATVPLGKRPRGAALAPDQRTLYVALSGSPIAPPGVDERTLPPADKSADGIGAVDLATRKLTSVLRGVSDPEQLALTPDGLRMFIASEDTGHALMVAVASGAVLEGVAVGGEPEGVAVTPDGHAAYVTSEEDHTVTVLDGVTGRPMRTLKVGLRPRAIAFARDGSRGYVSNENDASVTVIDARRHRVLRTIRLGDPKLRPMGVAVSPDGRTLYVATGRGGSVVVVDPETGKTRRAIAVGARPWGIALSPDGRWLYTANGPSNDVSVIDTQSLTRVADIKVGNRPWGVTVGP